MIQKLKKTFVLNVKNLIGWRTKRKIVVFAIDDYGNVRVHSKKAREKMNRAGLKVHSRFDAYDAMETTEDLEVLFQTLSSVKDKNARPAVFTPFALPCNIDFERMSECDFQTYFYELLPQTFDKLANLLPKAYEGAWSLWQEGMEKGLLQPQFHGREHLNLKILKEKLASRNPEALAALRNRSYTSISQTAYPAISYTAAFGFWEMHENDDFTEIVRDGLNRFEQVFGFRSVLFNSPGGTEHPVIHKQLKDTGDSVLRCSDSKKGAPRAWEL